jgi:hypothetical protein
MNPPIHYVSLDDVLTQPDALLASCGASGDWTTRRSLVTCPCCREIIGLSRPPARPGAGDEQLEAAEES